jgi:uncharacterized protein
MVFQVVEIAPSLVDVAVDLTQKHQLRGYDALQLASALDFAARQSRVGMSPLVLVSADRELTAAAAAEGLATDDLNAHP